MNDAVPVQEQQTTQEDSNDAFAAGFSAAREGTPAPIEPAKAETPAPDAEAKPEVKEEVKPAQEVPAKAAAPDPMAEVLGRIDAGFKAFESRLKPLEGRVGQLQSLNDQFAELKKATATAAQSGAPVPTQTQQADATKSGAKWEKLKEEFPEWAEAVEERFGRTAATQSPVDEESIRAKVREDFNKDLATREAEIRKQAQEEAQKAALVAMRSAMGNIVKTKYPDWVETTRSDDFKKWQSAQPDEVKRLAFSEDASDAIALLDKFHEAKRKDKESQRRLAGATTPKGVPVTAASGLSEEAAFDAGYAKGRTG